MSGSRPDFAIVSGVSRAVMLDQPAMKFLTIDVDDTASHFARTTENILPVLSQGISEDRPDFEFIQHHGTLHVGRFAPEKMLNSRFRRKQGLEIASTSLIEAKPCQFSLGDSGQAESSFFKKMESVNNDLEPDYVEVDFKSVDIDAHSRDILLGKFKTEHGLALLQFEGTVVSTGTEVISLTSGDRIVALAPSLVVSRARVLEWACIKMKDNELERVCTPMLSACNTVLYVLRHCAQLFASDLVLVFPGASNIGIHAIQATELADKNVYATTRTVEEEEYLINKLHIRKDHLFDINDPYLAETMLAATENRGFDLILGASNEALPPALWDACADFGRIIETVLRSSDNVFPNPHIAPSRGISYTAFNLHEMFNLASSKTPAHLEGVSSSTYCAGLNANGTSV